MKHLVWCVVLATLLCHLGPVESHRSRRGEKHARHDEGHGGGATFHHSSHHRPHEKKGHGGGTVMKDEDYEEDHRPGQNQTTEIEPKFINIGFLDIGRIRSNPEKLLVFNDDRYEPWSNWSDCMAKDCIEVRYRKCKDESWTKPVTNKIHTTNCLSKYFAEKRTCQNKTTCNTYVIPEKLSETCGIRPKSTGFVPKIVGGANAVPHSWPWAVRLSIKPPGRKAMTLCGGTLVAPQWVLTAAHCLLVENKRMPVGRLVNLRDEMKSAVYVHFGDHDMSKKESAQQDIRVEKAILHPRYHRKLLADGDDIALLYLPKPPNLVGTEVGYACLPTKDLQLESGTRCYAVGWGDTRPGTAPTFDDIFSIFDSMLLPDFGFPGSIFSRPFSASPFFRKARYSATKSPVLREVELPILSTKECRKYYPDLNEDVHLCAGSKGKDTCSGDSGGGLFCQLPNSDRWFTAGVTSFGLVQGCGKNPGVYTSVMGHLDWVTQVISTSVF